VRFQGSTHFLILLTGNPSVAKKKLDEITYIRLMGESKEGLFTTAHVDMEDLDLTMNAEKTRIVRAEEGFDFLGFRFVRQYSQWRKKRVTIWFPSPKSEMMIRERILALTGNNALALTTPEEAKEILIPVLRGWGNYFSHSLASDVFNGIWEYAQDRLMYMYCRQHNLPSNWRS
jgi:hypothetical protein